MEKLYRAYRLGYIYLAQRAHDNPDLWSSPGTLKMIHPSLARQIMELLSERAILSMPDDWTILEPIRYRNVNNNVVDQGYFFRALHQIMRAATDNGDGAITAEIERNVYVKKGNDNNVLSGDWDIGHDINNNTSIRFDREKQRAMEKGRVALLQLYPEVNALPCTLYANYMGNQNAQLVGAVATTCAEAHFPYLAPPATFAAPRA